MREPPEAGPEPSGSHPDPSPGARRHAPRPLVVEVDAAFRGLHAAVEQFVEAAAARYGVNRNDQHCLELLDRHGAMTAGELATAAGLSAAAVTKVVDRLISAGYAQRTRAAHDRRRVIIATTGAERRLAGEVFGPLVRDGMVLLSERDDDELRALLDLLRRATDLNLRHAERLRAGPAG